MEKNTKTYAPKQAAPKTLEELRAQAQAIHEERYKKNEAWSAELRTINEQIVELESQIKAEANGAA